VKDQLEDHSPHTKTFAGLCDWSVSDFDIFNRQAGWKSFLQVSLAISTSTPRRQKYGTSMHRMISGRTKWNTRSQPHLLRFHSTKSGLGRCSSRLPRSSTRDSTLRFHLHLLRKLFLLLLAGAIGRTRGRCWLCRRIDLFRFPFLRLCSRSADGRGCWLFLGDNGFRLRCSGLCLGGGRFRLSGTWNYGLCFRLDFRFCVGSEGGLLHCDGSDSFGDLGESPGSPSETASERTQYLPFDLLVKLSVILFQAREFVFPFKFGVGIRLVCILIDVVANKVDGTARHQGRCMFDNLSLTFRR